MIANSILKQLTISEYHMGVYYKGGSNSNGKTYAVSTLDFVFSVNLENWTYSYPTPYFSHALLPNSYVFDSESSRKFSKIMHEEVYMLEEVTSFEVTKSFSCSVWMLMMT